MIATCATLATVLASAQAGETINLAKGSDCPRLTITRRYPRQVTLNLGGSTLRGVLVKKGGGIRFRSGTIRAPQGLAIGWPGYAAQLDEAVNVRFDGVLFTDAKKGLAIGGGSNISVADSRFWRIWEDGIIASRVNGFSVTRSRFWDTHGSVPTCTVGGVIGEDVGRAACAAQGGTWLDGRHEDAIQMLDGMKNVVITNNDISGTTQGITQMDTAGKDAPFEDVLIADNRVFTDAYHRITITSCLGTCVITRNAVGRAPGSRRAAIIIARGGAVECGNEVQDARSEPCRS